MSDLPADASAALRAAHGVLKALIEPDMRVSVLHVYAQAREAELKVRSVLLTHEQPA